MIYNGKQARRYWKGIVMYINIHRRLYIVLKLNPFISKLRFTGSKSAAFCEDSLKLWLTKQYSCFFNSIRLRCDPVHWATPSSPDRCSHPLENPHPLFATKLPPPTTYNAITLKFIVTDVFPLFQITV